MIVEVIKRIHPEWEPPEDNGREWVRTCCPFHAEERPSAAVSYEHQAFNCMACGVKGNSVTLIQHLEEVSYSEAKRIAQEIAGEGDNPVPREPAWEPGRRVFSEPRPDLPKRGQRRGKVPPRVRGRPVPWA